MSDGAMQAALAEMPAAEAAARFDYLAWGLRIRSELAVPDFSPATAGATPDLVIARGPIGEPVPAMLGDRRIGFTAHARSFVLGGVGGFRIARFDRIRYQAYPGFDETLLALALVGPVMAMLLDLRGMLVLHGSAIAFGAAGQARAALFLGDKGAGKSTTAAACIAAGHRLLTDDVVAVALDVPGDARAVPGFPQVKLTDAAAAQIALAGVTPIATPVEGFGKQRLRIDGAFDPAPVDVGTVYVLERGAALGVTELAGVEALTAIMRFSYLPRFGAAAMQGAVAARHLTDCAALARRARVCKLTVPAALDRLGEAVDFVARDVARAGH